MTWLPLSRRPKRPSSRREESRGRRAGKDSHSLAQFVFARDNSVPNAGVDLGRHNAFFDQIRLCPVGAEADDAGSPDSGHARHLVNLGHGGVVDIDAAGWLRLRHGRKARKQQAEALLKMSLKDAAKQLAAVSAEEPAELPEAKIVRPVFATRGNAALKPVIQQEDDADELMFAAMRKMNSARGGAGHLRAVVTETDGD